MKKQRVARQRNLASGEEELDILAAFDFTIQQFSPYHFRINERLDVWPSTKKWYDRWTHRKGRYSSLVEFAQEFFNRPITDENNAVRMF